MGMREKMGKGAPGRTQGRGISWAEKSSFWGESSESDWEACKQGCLERRAREMLCIPKDPVALGDGVEGSGSASEWAAQRL